MRLYQHCAVSAAISTGIYIVSRSPQMAISSFAAGFLIDLDHIVDYWREHPLRFDIIHFFRTCQEFRLKKTYLWLHSVELTVPFLLLAAAAKDPLVTGLFLGWVQHMVFDCIFNPISLKGYFFTYRLRQKFVNEKIFDIPEEFRSGRSAETGDC